MPVRNQNWYDLQAGRRYPLDDKSTGIDDAGNMLDDSIIVDCHMRFPNTAGEVAFVQAITVSNTLVTIVIGAADKLHQPGQIKTIAALNLVKPVQLNKNYGVTALFPGVAGWIVFGAGIKNNYTARYTAPVQSLILPRCARPYRPLPIPTIGKVNLATALSGIVDIEALAPIVAERKTLAVANTAVDAIEFRLDGNLTNVDYDPYRYFLAECGQRPESGTCPKQPIESINGVLPDCNGNINIVGDGIDIYPFTPNGGLGLDIPLGLADVCNRRRYDPPREGVDECASSSSSSHTSSTTPQSSSNSSASSNGGGASDSSDSSTTSISQLSLPFCQPFTATLSTFLTVISGRFAAKNKTAPIKCAAQNSSSSSSSVSTNSNFSSSSSSCLEVGLPNCDCGFEQIIRENGCPGYACLPCSSSSSSNVIEMFTAAADLPRAAINENSSSSSSSSSYSPGGDLTQINQIVCASDEIFSTNIAILRDYPTDWAINRSVTLEFKVAPGVSSNAGLIFNYLPPTQANAGPTYMAAVVDADRGVFMLLRYNGSNFVLEYALTLADLNFTFDSAAWHRITVNPVLISTGVNVNCTLSDSAETRFVTFSVNVNNYGAPIGAVGLFADRAYVYFNKLTVE